MTTPNLAQSKQSKPKPAQLDKLTHNTYNTLTQYAYIHSPNTYTHHFQYL